jgi:pyruvate formate lyase activating enzyme
MHIKNWVQLTLADYPQKIAASLFCGGCNFRCPNCHNRELVLSPARLPDLPQDEILGFLEARIGLLDGVVISGGEPTLQSDLIPFARRLREIGYAVKLDTNGYRPDVLRAAVSCVGPARGAAVDYVAMDVKAPLYKYALATGVQVNTASIEQSIDLLLGSDVECEFRTTVVPGLLNEQDIAEIAADLARRATAVGRALDTVAWYLQQFVPHNTLDPAMLDLVPYFPDRLRAMADLARRSLPRVELRGI